MTHTHAAAHALAHAAEHDAGTCKQEVCQDLTGDDYRKHAAEIDIAAGRRFAALDDASRKAYARAAALLVETENAPEPEDDYGLGYARRYGRVSAVLEELLDLVGLAGDEADQETESEDAADDHA